MILAVRIYEYVLMHAFVFVSSDGQMVDVPPLPVLLVLTGPLAPLL